jgi:hypothetical protein
MVIMRAARSVAGIVGLGLVAAACTGGGNGGGGGDGASGLAGAATARCLLDPDAPVEEVNAIPTDAASALDDPDDASFPEPLVETDCILSGGPPPDGIPAIDEPKFLDPGEVDFLEDREPVMAIEIEGDARAYPLQIMTWHEIANDEVGGVPVTVTYCPLCNTAIAYDRRLGGEVLDFGTSGKLYNSALVMYDRQTESLWSHFTAQGIVGALTGARLDTVPVDIVSWEEWREANPDGRVLSRDTGHDRRYGENPYAGYDDIDSPAFLFDGEVDGRLAAKEFVVGIERGEEQVAVRTDHLADEGVVEVELGGRNLTVWHDPGTRSALDSAVIAEADDVGTTSVFVPEVDGQELTFERTDDGFVDDQTGSAWDVFGTAIDGPLEGSELEPVIHVDTFWFAWGAFRAETQIVPEPEP